MKDEFGNEMEVKIHRKGNKIVHTVVYILPKGKATLKGEHPKLRDEKSCPFPERQSCNRGVGFGRCKYMKYKLQDPYVISSRAWCCTCKEGK